MTAMKVGTPPVDYSAGVQINYHIGALLDSRIGKAIGKQSYETSQSSTSTDKKVDCIIDLGAAGYETGSVIVDVVTLNGVKIPTFTACNVHGANLKVANFSLPVDGIFALGLNSNGTDTTIKPLLFQFKNLEYTIYFNKKASYSNQLQKNVGELTLGGKDTKNCRSDYTHFPLFKPHTDLWDVRTVSVVFNKRRYYLKQQSGLTRFAIFEQTSDFIMVNDNILKAIYKYYNVKDAKNRSVNCNRAKNGPSIFFRVSGHVYAIKSTDYVTGFHTGKCDLRVAPLSYFANNSEKNPSDFVLGIPFFKSYCVNFNLAKSTVGFAHRK
ncbi:hypothetical protein M3Y95_00066800 [Aphelenchoides besseyi]|nr:hypothetical protein M3Y95_00066800 [Aphelenchoides besseyi]